MEDTIIYFLVIIESVTDLLWQCQLSPLYFETSSCPGCVKTGKTNISVFFKSLCRLKENFELLMLLTLWQYPLLHEDLSPSELHKGPAGFFNGEFLIKKSHLGIYVSNVLMKCHEKYVALFIFLKSNKAHYGSVRFIARSIKIHQS